jgi:type II secretory pathway component PulK
MRPPRASAGERGVALYLVITFVAFVAIVTTSMLASFHALMGETARRGGSLAALYVAEGGLARARAALAQDRGFAGESLAIGRGTAEIKVEGGAESRVVHVRGVVPDDGAPGATTGATIERRITATLRLGGAAGLPVVTAWREE